MSMVISQTSIELDLQAYRNLLVECTHSPQT
jgi:hypothetical protein